MGRNLNKHLNLNWTLLGVVGLGIMFWIAVLFFKDIKQIDWNAIQEIPTAVGWLTPFVLAFCKWGWRWRIFKNWLVLVPDLNGTWEGTLKSTWVDPSTTEKASPKKVYLIIRQTLFSIHCCQLTAESPSYSRTATVHSTADGEINFLEYIYSNHPKPLVQQRSPAHEGACCLQVIEKPSRQLVGKYWTERETKGELELYYLSKEYREVF